jgi:protein MAK11
VKAIDTLSIALPSTTSSPNCAVVKTTTIACTISSDGQIHLYNLASLSENLLGEPQRLEPVVTYDTKGTRLTCLTIAGGDAEAPGVGKRKRLDGGYGSHEDDLDEEGAEAHEDDNAENERDGSGDDLEALPE